MSNFTLQPSLTPTDVTPYWLNTADNSWQLTAATLVGLQSIPGFIILYAAGVKKKWAVNSALMTIYAFACTTLCWVGWGYRLAFGEQLVLFWGIPELSLDQAYLVDQSGGGLFPNATMAFFQLVFAALAVICLVGAVLGRMSFYAWMLFVPLWLTFSYTVGAYSVWCSTGFLAAAGVIDFAGGYVIHLASGVSGYTAAYWVGPRLTRDRKNFPPNNIPLMLAGAGLLWMGWSGFNGGAPALAGLDASLAVLNTHVCASTSMVVWLILDVAFFKKPSVIGAVQGLITGLVCITPGAGVVQGWAAVIMGILAAFVPWYTMMVVHKRSNLLQQVDDTMAVLHTHAVAGSLGGILTGFFAHPKLTKLFYPHGHHIGLLYGLQNGESRAGFRQLGLQLAGIVFIVVINVVVTSIICVVVRFVVPLRLSEEMMEVGDGAVHGEEAYSIVDMDLASDVKGVIQYSGMI